MPDKNLDWDTYFTQLCKLVASKSKDRSTKVGCIITDSENIIRSTGYNGFVRGANDNREDWHQRPMKYKVTPHAEKNAVCQAARVGVSLNGCRAYVSLTPCPDCTTMLIQAGIKEIIALVAPPNWDGHSRWDSEFSISKEILDEVGIPIRFLE
jgi:dCMP deaminase